MTPSPDHEPRPAQGVAAPTAEALATAFTTFNSVAQQLESAYQSLERQLARASQARQAVPQPGSQAAQRTAEATPGTVVVLNEHGQVLLTTQPAEQRKVEELLSRHQRLAALGEMAAGLAHQIRTPLAAALLYASNATRAELPRERRDELLGKAIGCLHDLEQLISDMLQFARGARLADTGFRLAELLDAVETSLRPAVGPRQSLSIERPAADVTLSGNREALAGALLNLANNALQAGGERARVRISVRTSDLQTEILVADNGPGVPVAIRSRIFEPFFTSRPDGTGLGLAVARSVARAHQGDVALVEDATGGATFALRLPVATGRGASHPHHRNAAA